MTEDAQNTQRTLGRIEGKLDALLDAQTDHSQRLEKVERFTNRLAGAMSLLTVSVPFLVFFVSHLR